MNDTSLEAHSEHLSGAFIFYRLRLFGSTNLATAVNLAVIELIISRTCFGLVRSLVIVSFSKGGGLDVSLLRSRRVSFSTVTRLTDAEFCVRCLSLQKRPVMVRPNLYCSFQGSSSFPKMTFIGWKAAGTLRPISRPISTSERCCILSTM